MGPVLLVLSLTSGGCIFGGTGPSSEPGPGVHAELISNNVFLGNCLANLSGCGNEMPQGAATFGGFAYWFPAGSLVTVRACIAHPGIQNRDLYTDLHPGGAVDRTAVPPFYREETRRRRFAWARSSSRPQGSPASATAEPPCGSSAGALSKTRCSTAEARTAAARPKETSAWSALPRRRNGSTSAGVVRRRCPSS